MVNLPRIKHSHLFIEEWSQSLRLASFLSSLYELERDPNALLEEYWALH